MFLTAKKIDYIFKPLNLIVDKIFCCVVNSPRKDSQAEKNKYLTWRADWGGEHNTPRHTACTLFSYQQLKWCK